MFGKLFLLFTVVPAIEIYLLFQIGDEIGALNTLFLIVVTGIVGASFARSQGFEALMKIQTQMNQGGLPANEIIHGLMIFAGGILLITPGVLTDIVGLALVAPGSRHLLFKFFKNMIMTNLKSGNIKFAQFGSRGGGFSYSQDDIYQEETQRPVPGHIDGDVIEAEFTEKN